MNGNSTLRSVLTFLDESPSTAAAVELGIAWGKRTGALVVGLGVVDEPLIRGARCDGQLLPSYRGAYTQLVSEACHSVEQRLDRFSRRCLEAGVAYKLLEDTGLPGNELLREAQRYDVLLAGRDVHLGGGASEESLGHFLRRTPRPLVVVPPGGPTCGSVLVAYDGSPEAARSLHAFAASGLTVLGDVHVLALSDQSPVCAAKTADLAVEFLRFHEIDASPLPLCSTSTPAKTILDEAHRVDAGLIVMGACGRAPMREYLLGSTTRTLLRQSRLPLFLYH